MKNTFGSITYHLGLKQSTVRRFCNDFRIEAKDQFIGEGFISSSILKQEFIEFLKENIEFLRKYQQDYYSDKNPWEIAKTINRNVNEIETYLKEQYPQYYEDGKIKLESKKLFKF